MTAERKGEVGITLSAGVAESVPGAVYVDLPDGVGVNVLGLPVLAAVALLKAVMTETFDDSADVMIRNADAGDRLPPGAWYVLYRKGEK